MLSRFTKMITPSPQNECHSFVCVERERRKRDQMKWQGKSMEEIKEEAKKNEGRWNKNEHGKFTFRFFTLQKRSLGKNK